MTIQLFNNPSRRQVLGGMAVGGMALAAPSVFSKTIDVDTEVVVIGAGGAGIGASAALRLHGIDHIVVEASDRVGGRALTAQNDLHFNGKPVPFDIGCAWIHEAEYNNAIVGWARGLDFDLHWQDVDRMNVLYYGAERQDTLRDRAEKIGEEISQRLKDGYCDQPGGDVAANTPIDAGYRPFWNQPLDAAEDFSGPMDEGIAYNKASSRELCHEAGYAENYLVPRGYGTLVEAISNRVFSAKTLRKNARVTRIDREGGVVKVSLQDGGGTTGTIRARHVIVTTAIGALKRGTIKIDSLPDRHREAINSLEMGLLTKIPMIVKGIKPGDQDIQPYQNVLVMDPNRGTNTYAGKDVYFLAWPFDVDMMVGFIGGDLAWDLAKSNDGNAATFALAEERLRNVYGSKVTVDQHLVTPWGNAEGFWGAYSAATPGHFQARLDLTQPVDDQIFFAGEATAPDGMFATLGGAYSAGFIAARKIWDIKKARAG